MNNILYISNYFPANEYGGRQSLCHMNYEIIKSIMGPSFFELFIKKNSTNPLAKFFGEIDGINKDLVQDIYSILEDKSISRVFLDGSNLGHLALCIKNFNRKIMIYTFFHNVETVFFFWSFRERKTLKSLGILIANYLSERKAVKNSDKLICLNTRDGNLLEKIFKKQADFIFPLSLRDQYIKSETLRTENNRLSLLFVGSNFYANKYGIEWFVENVMPYINADLLIIGRGMDLLKDKFSIYKNIRIESNCIDLNSFYDNCDIVIAPIFDGSGMKTKVAEALMNGKTILGTNEAFVGYESLDLNELICNTSDQFIKKINKFELKSQNVFLKKYRYLYEKEYSYEAQLIRYKNMLKE